MEKTTAVKIIREAFESQFNKEKFAHFARNLLNDLDENSENAIFALSGNQIPEAFKKHINSYSRIGKFKDSDNKVIDVLTVKLARGKSIERARSRQRNFVRWYLNGGRGNILRDAALVAFYSEDYPDWRFSLIKMEYKFEGGKVVEELTPAKRFSFLVGKNESSHTAQKQIIPILQNDRNNPTLKELEKAFCIEVVNDEFYEKYKELFGKVKHELDKIIESEEKVKNEFKKNKVNSVDFSKKLLGQIVFIYFLQKKGWLGVKKGEKWGNGPKDFVRGLFRAKLDKDLFTHDIIKFDNFFNDILEPLFYDALAIDRDIESYYPNFRCRIPFLNGGLFEPIGNYSWQNIDILLPNELFSNDEITKEGDKGTGIFDVFERYNFTVNEAEPLDKEVAIDPEMLGKVFERMLDVKERKSKGAFYTPREIVQYMSQESLINFLATEIPSIPKKEFETLIHKSELILETEEIAKIAHDKITAGDQKSTKHESELSELIKDNAELIDKKIADVYICDPAIGSGAFPVGVMTEIVKTRTILTHFIKSNTKNRTPYDFKLKAIKDCLYGVDIEPSAVDIAKLRLWLSLVVDEDDLDSIKPLPNLDYKIVQGDSLIGIETDLYNQKQLRKLEKLKTEYFDESVKRKKDDLRKQINALILTLTDNSKQFDFRIYFSEVFNTNSGFDIVIANPPYFNLEVNSIAVKHYLKKHSQVYAGKADILYFFFEKGLSLLKKAGTLIFITSRYYLEATYAKSLRSYISKNFYVREIVDFENCSIFESVGIHNAITTISKTSSEIATSVKFFTAYNNDNVVSDENFRKFYVQLNTSDWLLADESENKLLNIIRNNSDLLGSIAIIEQGQKTGLNKIFCITEEVADRLEKQPLKKVIKGSHINKYNITYHKLYLIYTDKNFDICKYPKIKDYLFKHKTKLEKRAEAKDKIYPWFRLQRPRSEKLFSSPEKIVVPYRAECNQFAYDNHQYFNDGGDIRIIVIKQPIEISTKYCLSILNSKLMSYYYRFIGRKKGKLYEYFLDSLKKIPIRKISKSKQRPFIELVDKILKITRTEDYLQNKQKQVQVKSLETQIDQLVYKLYGLTQEEIAIVEGKA